MDPDQALAAMTQAILARRIGEEIIRAAQIEARLELATLGATEEPTRTRRPRR